MTETTTVRKEQLSGASAPARRPSGTGRPRAHASHRTAQILMTAVALLLAVYFLFPLVWQVVASTKTSNQLATTPGLLPLIPVNLRENLTDLVTRENGIFLRWMLNSVLYAVIGGLAATAFSGAAGYALAFLRFRGKTALTVAILIGTLLPGTVLAFPLFLVMVRFGLVDTYWSVLLPSMISPLAIFLARMFASQAMPYSMIEAARIDGAGEIRIALGFGFRLMAPGLVTIFLIQVVAIWNNFFLPLILLNDTELFPSTLGLYVWNSRVTQAPEYTVLVIVGALVSALPLIALFLTLQRYWRSGLAAGAVKG